MEHYLVLGKNLDLEGNSGKCTINVNRVQGIPETDKVEITFEYWGYGKLGMRRKFKRTAKRVEDIQNHPVYSFKFDGLEIKYIENSVDTRKGPLGKEVLRMGNSIRVKGQSDLWSLKILSIHGVDSIEIETLGAAHGFRKIKRKIKDCNKKINGWSVYSFKFDNIEVEFVI